MKLVNDEIFLDSLTNAIRCIKIDKNPEKYKKKVLINLMPLFGLKQLVIFIRLGEFLKKQGIFVDYFSCNRFFNHCDMVKINDQMDRYLACERCEIVEKKLDLQFEKNLTNKFIWNRKYDIYLDNSKKRCCGNKINYKKYFEESKENIVLSDKLILGYDFIISLNHFQNYSIAPLFDKFNDKNKLFLGIERGHGNKIVLFADDKEKTFNLNVSISNEEKDKVKRFFLNRINFGGNGLNEILNKFKKSGKKIVTLFPNILEDSFFNSSGEIFTNMYEWLEKTVKFLLKNDFSVIIKKHPDEKKWNPVAQMNDYFDKNDNLFFIDDEISAYDLLKISDVSATYNGTVFFEALVLEKKIVLGGQIGKIKHTSAEEYFSQFIDYKKYDLNLAMEYAYKLYFMRSVELYMINSKLPYPYIDPDSEVENEIAFHMIKDIILGNYNPDKYKKFFISLY